MKWNKKRLNRILLFLAILSLVITFIEGWFYYSGEEFQNPFFRLLLIIQNSIKAFGFKAPISIESVLKSINDNPSAIECFIGVAYALASFVAPFCTLSVLYKMTEYWMKMKGWHFFHLKKSHMIVFGYSADTKALLFNKEDSENMNDYKIHVVDANISKDDELELLKIGVEVHKVDCLSLDEKKLIYYLKHMELKRAKRIVLFDESSAQNFSLYYMFHNLPKKLALPKDVKFYVRCEDDAIHKMVEDYYDVRIGSKEGSSLGDLELISIPELRIRKLLKEHVLHSYYLSSIDYDTKSIEAVLEEMNQWNLHLLIVGFGKLGEQLLLQAMNQGVTGTNNSILIDVIDYRCEEKMSVFINKFNENYVQIDGLECNIPSECANGTLKIRFHKMDIRYKNFQKKLTELGDPKKDGVFTYAAVCITNPEVSLHCMTELNRYYSKYNDYIGDHKPCIAVRMDLDKQMAGYLNKNKQTYENVYVIQDSDQAVSLQNLINDTVDADAKKYNHIYQNLFVGMESGGSNQKEVSEEDAWKQLKLFRRNSNRALALHDNVKQTIINRMREVDFKAVMDKTIGTDGRVLQYKKENTWEYKDLNKFIDDISDRKKNILINEFCQMEHRRWCYFMASNGWKRTEDFTAEKKDETHENPCMCPWDELVKYQKAVCVYDLMPLLIKYISK